MSLKLCTLLKQMILTKKYPFQVTAAFLQAGDLTTVVTSNNYMCCLHSYNVYVHYDHFGGMAMGGRGCAFIVANYATFSLDLVTTLIHCICMILYSQNM